MWACFHVKLFHQFLELLPRFLGKDRMYRSLEQLALCDNASILPLFDESRLVIEAA